MVTMLIDIPAVILATSILITCGIGGGGFFWVLWKHYPRSNPYDAIAETLPPELPGDMVVLDEELEYSVEDATYYTEPTITIVVKPPHE